MYSLIKIRELTYDIGQTRFVFELKQIMQIGTAEVGIYQQDPLAHLSQGDSQIDRSGTLALAL